MQDPSDRLTPGWLAAFLAVARHRNYTRAAEELFLTQPAVSRQMQSLQKMVGVPLVEQIGKSIELTDAGRAFLREAERVRAGILRSTEALETVRKGDAGRLRIGASTTPGFYLLPRVLGPFLRKRPRAEVAYLVDNTLKIEEGLLRNELDVGFVGGHLATGELMTEPFVRDEVVVYAAASHPLARLRRVEPSRLAEHTLIVREPGSATRELFEDWLKERRLDVRRRIELHCPEAIKTLVEAGVGFAVTSCHGLDRARSRLKQVKLPGFRIERTILIARHPDKKLSPLVQEFIEAAQRAMQSC